MKLLSFFQHQQASLKKQELELLTDIFTGGKYHGFHQYVEANNKYMKNYDKNKG